MSKKETEKEIQEITQKIVDKFAPEKVILFGSWAWGNPGADSDVDLFILKQTERSSRELAREIDGFLWGRTVPLDILVYKPENLRKRLKSGDFFIQDIIKKGKLLYEQI